MTIREWLKANNKDVEMEICIYNEKGKSPRDDENIKKYIDEPYVRLEYDNDDCIDVFFSDEIINK